MKFSYHILSDLDLILECYTGDFEYKDIFDFKRTEIKDPEWRDYYNVLADIRKGSITLTNDDILNMHKYLETNPLLNARRKSAILTDRPDQVVFGTLLQGYNDEQVSLIVPKVFSTIKSALSWLGVDLTEIERIEEILDQLTLETS